MLPHLNKRNSARHFIVMPSGFWCLGQCQGVWSSPNSVFKDIARVTNQVGFTSEDLKMYPSLRAQHSIGSPIYNKSDWGHRRMHMDFECAYPRLYTVPYPGMIHMRSEDRISDMPWSSKKSRPILALFVGSTLHGDVAVRGTIQRFCERYKNRPKLLSCLSSSPTDRLEAISTKAKSIFCLEPVGDSIGRKSVTDSYNFGCIPVFFGSAQAFQYPAYWDGWYNSAFLAFNRQLFIGGHLDPVVTLEQVPKGRVRRIQDSIRTFGARFQYSYEETGEMDGVEVLLRRLFVDAEQLRPNKTKS